MLSSDRYVSYEVPAALLRFIILSQSARCFWSSSLLFGGRKEGLVLLTTLSNTLGPTDRVGLWLIEDGGDDADDAGREPTDGGGKRRDGVDADLSWVVCSGGVTGSSSEADVSGGSSDWGGDGGGDSWIAFKAIGSERGSSASTA
jgi:hypothetical protein